MNSKVTIEFFRENSLLGWAPGISIVDKLVDSKWCTIEDLQTGFKCFGESGLDIVVIFFQLPFVIKLPPKWIKIKSQFGHPFFLFKVIGSEFNTISKDKKLKIIPRKDYQGLDNFYNAFLPNDNVGLLTRTQVIASFQLWGPRQKFYRNYLNSLKFPDRFKSVLVNESNSWLPSHHPLTGQTFEIELARRLKREVLSSINEWIPIYRIACKDPYSKQIDYLNNFFIMMETGRIVPIEPGLSTITPFVEQFNSDSFDGNTAILKKYASKKIKPTVYEEYLLEAVKLLEMKSTNLAVVHTVMILEWFANEMIQNHFVNTLKSSLNEHPLISEIALNRTWETSEGLKNWGTRIPIKEKFKRYFPAIGINLSKKHITHLIAMIELRNKIVHRTQTKQTSTKTADRYINIAFEVIDECRNILFQKLKGE